MNKQKKRKALIVERKRALSGLVVVLMILSLINIAIGPLKLSASEEVANNKQLGTVIDHGYANDYLIVKVVDGEAEVALNLNRFLEDDPEWLERGVADGFTQYYKVDNLGGRVRDVVAGPITDLYRDELKRIAMYSEPYWEELTSEYVCDEHGNCETTLNWDLSWQKLKEQVGDRDPNYAYNFQTIAFLMEDGSLEYAGIFAPWLKQQLNSGGLEGVLKSEGSIPWVKNVVNVSAEFTNHGDENATSIFAYDEDGVKHDLRYAIDSKFILNYTSITDFLDQVISQQRTVYGFRTLSEEEVVSVIGWWRSEASGFYHGSVVFNTAVDESADSYGKPGMAGTVSVNLELESSSPYVDLIDRAQGSYIIEYGASSPLSFKLRLLEGDPLIEVNDTQKEIYTFEEARDFESWYWDDCNYIMPTVPDFS